MAAPEAGHYEPWKRKAGTMSGHTMRTSEVRTTQTAQVVAFVQTWNQTLLVLCWGQLSAPSNARTHLASQGLRKCLVRGPWQRWRDSSKSE